MNRVPVISLRVDPDQVLQRKHIGCCSKTMAQLVTDTGRLISSKDMRETMGTRARDHAIRYHSLNNIDQIMPLLTEKNPTQ